MKDRFLYGYLCKLLRFYFWSRHRRARIIRVWVVRLARQLFGNLVRSHRHIGWWTRWKGFDIGRGFSGSIHRFEENNNRCAGTRPITSRAFLPIKPHSARGLPVLVANCRHQRMAKVLAASKGVPGTAFADVWCNQGHAATTSSLRLQPCRPL